ncbi:YaiO family outer membrane beta-barrel protein [Novilysobacter luteus]|nr:YaiO family outer membrane beta-barrel protein [Lysobacter luteus]
MSTCAARASRTTGALRVLLALAAPMAHAQAQTEMQASTPRESITISHRGESPDNGLQAWNAQRLDYARNQPGNWSVGASLVREARFGQVDGGAELRGALSVGDGWSVQGEVGAFPHPHFQPEWFADVRVERPMARVGEATLVGSAGLRRTRYRDTTVDRLAVGTEVYRGNWRFGYTFNLTRVDGSSLPGHALALDRYYGDDSWVGLRLDTGEEDALLPGDVVATEIDSIGLRGRHWWTPAWALEWGGGHVAQSDLYDRRWWMLGVRHAF